MRTKTLAIALLTVVALMAPTMAASAQDAETAQPPGPVRNLAVSADGSSVTVSWDAPDTGGDPTRYKVNLKPADGGKGKVKNPKARKTTVTYSNVKPGDYQVRVRALNDAGKSERVDATVTVAGGDTEPAYVGGSTPTTTVPVCQPRVDVSTLTAQTGDTFYLLPAGSGPWPADNSNGGVPYLTPGETCNAFGDRTAFIGGRYQFTRTLNVKVGETRIPHEPGWYAWIPGIRADGSPYVPLEVRTL